MKSLVSTLLIVAFTSCMRAGVARASTTQPTTGTTNPQVLALSLDESGEVLIAKDPAGKPVWSVNVADAVGQPHPLGGKKIRSYQQKGEAVGVVFGKSSHASVDAATGQVTFIGSD